MMSLGSTRRRWSKKAKATVMTIALAGSGTGAAAVAPDSPFGHLASAVAQIADHTIDVAADMIIHQGQ